jgi:hypothetical protein
VEALAADQAPVAARVRAARPVEVEAAALAAVAAPVEAVALEARVLPVVGLAVAARLEGRMARNYMATWVKTRQPIRTTNLQSKPDEVQAKLGHTSAVWRQTELTELSLSR